MNEITPKYYQLKKVIIEKINNEEYQSDLAIPSERELMETYKVSRITVRKAIDELVNGGYLYKVQGKGTYVKGDEKSSDLISITSCTEDVKRLGKKPTKKMIEFTLEKPNSKKRKALELTSDDKVFKLCRVLYADNRPINYTITYFPEKIFPGIDSHSFDKESLYKVMQEDYGVSITKANRTIEAVQVQDDVATYLEMEPGAPVILFRCVTYGMVGGKELPIESFKCFYRTDEFKFYINQVKK